MKQITILLLSSLLVIGNLTVTAKDDKKKASELAALSGGVIYSLPRTGIRMTVEVSQEKYFHGPYFEYAQKYLGITSAPANDSEIWKITDLKMETFGEPDPAEVHKATGAVASMLSLSENGVLIGINSSVKGQAAKTHTSVFTPGVEVPRAIWSEMSMHSFLEAKDTVQRAGEKIKSFEEKAAEAAQDIVKFRKRKAKTLAGTYEKPLPDGKAYQLMVDELNKIISDYESLFIGKSYKSTHSYVFEVVPEAKENKALVAFRFSPTAGVMPENNVSGKPIMLELDPNLELTRNIQQKATPASGETSTAGLFYRTPAIVTARLLNGSDVVAQARLTMAQFGVVTPISDGLLNGEYSIELHPATGAIQRIGN